jgi:flagellar biosynthesis protein FliR
MIISFAQAQLFVLAFARVVAIMIHIPFLGGQVVPNQVRIGLGVIFTVVLIPWQPLPASAEALDIVPLVASIAREIVIGTLAGYACNLTFSALQIAGELMGLGSGFGSSRVLNPAMNVSGSSYDQFFVVMATLLFLVIDGHHAIILAIQGTFKLIPLNSAMPAINLERLTQMTGTLITAGVQLALPVMGALLLTDISLGLLSRVAPQIQVFFLGLPIKIGLSLVGMALLFTVVIPSLTEIYHAVGPRSLLLLGK